ncbi:MAG: phage Gp37/Gp68 family protein [Mesorhizobium sp.]|nr:MAG: phage Gp37/Gp68 family protein [Mesorhizobium sp.]
MGEVTAISWCDHTFNPWIGCMKVSPACDGCYAEALMDKRYGRVEWGAPGRGGAGTRVRTSAGNWHQPIRWNKRAMEAGTRPFVFCASLADVFDNQVPVEWRRHLFDLICNTPHLIWLLLTKRPQMIEDLAMKAGGLPFNAAIGATVEDQERADKNIPALRAATISLNPAFAFLSCEPLLGPINLPDGHHLNWVITGGETDQGEHRARPTHPAWVRSLRDQCAASGIAYHHKQNGEWARHKANPGGDLGGDVRAGRVRIVHPSGRSDVEVFEATGGRNTETGSLYMAKVGKRACGRLLDGIEHNSRPQVSR